MGGSNDKAQMKISLETLSVTAGGEASAMIHLQVREGINAKDLVLRFVGKERAEKKKESVVSSESLVFKWENGSVPAGQYSYPILFEIPRQIPSSFEALENTLKITYFLKAVLLDKSNKKIISDKAEIIVHQEVDAMRNSIRETQNLRVSYWCFFRGNVQINYHLDKFAYLPYEAPGLTLQFNTSTLHTKLRNVSYSLIRTILTKSKKFTDIIHVENLQMLDGGRAKANIPLFNHKELIENAATTHGKLIQCNYIVRVVLKFGTCANPVEFEIPLMIYPKENVPVLPEAPENWLPVEMPLSRINHSMEFKVEPTAPVLED